MTTEVPPPPALPPSAPALLRPWRHEDLDDLYQCFSDLQIQTHSWSSSRAFTRRDAQAYLAAHTAGMQQGDDVQWAVIGRDRRELVGCASVYAIRAATSTCSIGYWVAAPARGRGIATTVARTLATWAIDVLGMERVELTCGPDNSGSQRVAVRAGFILEGTLRSAVPFKGGRRDSLIYSMLPGDPRPLAQASSA